MKVLSIETSCDETGVAVVEKVDNNNFVSVLANNTATSLDIHAKTGGIIPENAAREQLKYIIPVLVKTLLDSEKIDEKDPEQDFLNAKKIIEEKIDAIAVTNGPGLVGSLLVGVETAKTLSFVFNKPIIPVNHLLAHIFANFIDNRNIEFPFVGLIVSGGHTDILYFKSFTDYKWLGGTRDDAAGEAIDKIGRLINLSYPAGPEMEQRAGKVENTSIKFKSPLLNSNDYDFSFSGLKAEVARFVAKQKLDEKLINEICYATQKAIIDVLVKKTISAATDYDVKTILVGGGVSANQTLMRNLKEKSGGIEIFVPEKKYTTDNAAMIGAYSLFSKEPTNWSEITALPELYFA